MTIWNSYIINFLYLLNCPKFQRFSRLFAPVSNLQKSSYFCLVLIQVRPVCSNFLENIFSFKSIYYYNQNRPFLYIFNTTYSLYKDAIFMNFSQEQQRILFFQDNLFAQIQLMIEKKQKGSAQKKLFKVSSRKTISVNNSSVGHSKKSRQSQSKDFNKSKELKQLMKGIPRTLFLQNDHLLEQNFSYVEDGFEKWKKGPIIKSGKVWQAMNTKTGVLAAIKQIDLVDTDVQSEKIRLRELNIMKKINHPNVVTYLEHYKMKQKVYILMEYVPNNLRKFYIQYGPPPVDIFLFYARQILEVLADLEKNKIFHQDIKCENILLTSSGKIKLCDFGCSKGFDSTISLYSDKQQYSKTIKGTYRWSAPQKLEGKIEDRGKADIWSLGCTFVELASAKLPWNNKNFENMLMGIKFIVDSGETPDLPENCPQKIERLISYCLQRNPDNRKCLQQILNQAEIWE